MATLKDVAELAGVSTASVSLYLNGKADGRVSAAKQQTIEEALRTLNYGRSRAVQNTGYVFPIDTNRTVAVYWASDARNQLLGHLVEGVYRSIEKHGLTDVNVAIRPYKVEELYRENSVLHPELYGYNAAIMANMSTQDMYFLDTITPVIPTSLLNRELRQYHHVGIDNKKMGASMADMMMEAGHRRIAMFSAISDYLAANDRTSGFIERCRELGIEIPNEFLFITPDSIDGGSEAARTFLTRDAKPAAAFFSSDSVVLGALGVLRKAGVRIPSDLSLMCISMNYSHLLHATDPPITASNVPIADMAEACMDQIADVFCGNVSEPIHTVLPTEIIVRESFVP